MIKYWIQSVWTNILSFEYYQAHCYMDKQIAPRRERGITYHDLIKGKYDQQHEKDLKNWKNTRIQSKRDIDIGKCDNDRPRKIKTS